jgi:hypothetical protein
VDKEVEEMPAVTVSITGADEAKFNWDGRNRTLTSTGSGKWSGGFNAASGLHSYFVEVAGQPKDLWNSEVTDGTSSDKVKGKMDGNGRGESGTRDFDVA